MKKRIRAGHSIKTSIIGNKYELKAGTIVDDITTQEDKAKSNARLMFELPSLGRVIIFFHHSILLGLEDITTLDTISNADIITAIT